MIRRTFAAPVALAVALALTLTACTGTAPAEGPQIVVTTNILGDVAREIAGEEATVTTLMKPNADPHSFQISAQQAARFGTADLVVSNGLGLEEGLQVHIDRAIDAGVTSFVAGEHIDVLAYDAADAEGAADPHFWTDPARMTDVVDALETAIAGIEGVDASVVAANAAAYRAQLAELDAEMTQVFAAIPDDRRALVTNHHVFGYLADRFDFRLVGAVIPGGATLAAPSAADLRELADAIERAGVPAIFAESSQPDRLVNVLANEAGIDVDVVQLFTESLSEPGQGAGTYLDMMRENTARIGQGLGTQSTHERAP